MGCAKCEIVERIIGKQETYLSEFRCDRTHAVLQAHQQKTVHPECPVWLVSEDDTDRWWLYDHQPTRFPLGVRLTAWEVIFKDQQANKVTVEMRKYRVHTNWPS